jgi:plasmid stability protein
VTRELLDRHPPCARSLDKCNHCYHSSPMAQLVVRKIEESVVARLRRRAARHGVSLEEEHRRILRAAVLPADGKEAMTLKEYLMEMPREGDHELFARPPAKPRRVRL